jgi:hypothetical protein
MSNISEVYGPTYQEKSILEKAIYGIKLYASNIAHKQFSFRNETPDMWVGPNMKGQVIQALAAFVQQNNPNMRVVHLDKADPQALKMLPYFVKGPVEYFAVVDMTPATKTQIYTLYITPTVMEPF